MALFKKICLYIAVASCVVGVTAALFSIASVWQAALVVGTVSLAIGSAGSSTLAGYQFTVWILTAVAAAMVYPRAFLHIGPLDLRNPWLMLVVVQLVMFGMGTKMSLRDFVGVAKMPYPVLIGISLQFLIMPLSGYLLTRMFDFPPEIAAGVVLIGSCSSGLASNVMCYLAGANLALSITLTAVATLLAPLATPFWMDRLAGELVEVQPMEMMIRIIKIVIVPIGAAMLHDALKHVVGERKLRFVRLGIVVAISCFLVGIAARQGWVEAIGQLPPALSESLIILGAAVGFAISFHLLAARFAWVEYKVHFLSMLGIVYFTTVTTAAGRDHLLAVGLALFFAAMLHNLLGYALGFSMSRLLGLDKRSAITVAFEVGMQNGGMASALAGLMGKLGTLGLAAAVFSPWMNVSGSVLANLIKKNREFSDQPHEAALQDQSSIESENVASI